MKNMQGCISYYLLFDSDGDQTLTGTWGRLFTLGTSNCGE